MSFLVPINNPSNELVAWYKVALNRLKPTVVEVFYGRFHDEAHFQTAAEPIRDSTMVVSIKGPTAQALLPTVENRLYDWVRALMGRLLTGTATPQELEDCEGWQVLAAAVLVPGVSHLDPDPFPLPVEGE